jgi:shikimate kinase
MAGGARGGCTIWLTGMMGAGKSSLGPRLAARMGRRFVDTDQEIERSAGQSVAELFAREGEAAFRARERALVEALAGAPLVVALGGGAVAQPGLRERLAASGTLVYLRARPETLLERVADAETRPLLRGLSRGQRLARLSALLAEREPHYASAAIVLDTDAAAVEDLVEELAARLAGAGARPA